jgi:hypothetical protein
LVKTESLDRGPRVKRDGSTEAAIVVLARALRKRSTH